MGFTYFQPAISIASVNLSRGSARPDDGLEPFPAFSGRR
jgi:hypothetical protein